MKQQTPIWKAGAILSGTFLSLSAVAQLLVFPAWISLVLVGACVIIGGASLMYYRKNPNETALTSALRVTKRRETPPFSVGTVRSVAELEDLWRIDRDAYGEANLPFDVFMDWWKRYQPGLVALRDDDDNIIG